MKLGPEADQPAAHLLSNSDKNLSFYLLQNTRLVALAFFQSRQLETQGLESRPDRDTMHTCPWLNRNLSF